MSAGDRTPPATPGGVATRLEGEIMAAGGAGSGRVISRSSGRLSASSALPCQGTAVDGGGGSVCVCVCV